MLETAPLAHQGVRYAPRPPTVDKTMQGRRHLTPAEVEKLLAAAKGSRYADARKAGNKNA